MTLFELEATIFRFETVPGFVSLQTGGWALPVLLDEPELSLELEDDAVGVAVGARVVVGVTVGVSVTVGVAVGVEVGVSVGQRFRVPYSTDVEPVDQVSTKVFVVSEGKVSSQTY